MMRMIFTLLTAFIATLAIAPIIIPWLKKLRFGQNVRTFGPKGHLKKQGVPTMGGIMITGVIVLCALAFSYAQGRLTIMAPAAAFVALGAGIGFLDDYIKVVRHRSLGLRARDKTWMLLLICAAFAAYAYYSPHIDTRLYVPFTEWKLDLGVWYIPFAVFVAYATINSANLLDGADGLLSGVTLVIAAALSLVFLFGQAQLGQTDAVYGNMMVLSAATTGACLGFLVFNKFPAKVIMGDTGSFALGSAVLAIMSLSGMSLFIPVLCVMYVVTALSDILQALSYKLRHRPMFRMAPLHHHLEMGGMRETKIVALYMAVTAVFAVVTLFAVR